MKVQVKSWGKSMVIVLDPVFLKFHDLKEGDWVDLSDICKVKMEKVKYYGKDILREDKTKGRYDDGKKEKG